VSEILSGQDKVIADMIAAKPTQSEININDYYKPHDFDLPKECEPYADKFDFRWLSKDSRMLDRAVNVKGWTIVNRTCDIKLPEHLFRAHGGVEKRSLLLAYRRKEIGDIFKKAAQAQSIENIKKARKDAERDKPESPFYTAKLSPKEEQDEEASGEVVQGRDF
jgi:hypothetical protein